MHADLPPTQPMSAADVARVLSGRRRQGRISLAIIAIAMCAFFAMFGTLQHWALLAPYRLPRLLGLVVVAAALSASTVVFQVVTRNRILSPSVMGFDSMYRLVSTLLIFVFTSNVVNLWPATGVFALQATLMTAIAVVLFTTLIRRGGDRIHLMVLVGIVFGTLLRSITSMLGAIMDPNEFQIVQDLGMASFATINQQALAITTGVTIAAICVIMWRGRVWDVLAMGRDVAIPLGVAYEREVRFALAISSVLVACATALVGPMMFFGLLIVNIAVYVVKTDQIRFLVPVSVFLGIAVLVGGQALLEFVLQRATVLPVVIELVGGALLLTMILKEARR